MRCVVCGAIVSDCSNFWDFVGTGGAHIEAKYIQEGSAQTEESRYGLMQPILTPDRRLVAAAACGVWQTQSIARVADS